MSKGDDPIDLNGQMCSLAAKSFFQVYRYAAGTNRRGYLVGSDRDANIGNDHKPWITMGYQWKTNCQEASAIWHLEIPC